MDDDIAAIEAWAEIFHHPAHLAKIISFRWITHGEAVKLDVHKEQDDWEHENYFDAGDDTAAALVDLIGPIENGHNFVYLPDLHGVPDFAAGLVYGLTGHNHLDEIRHCFDGSSAMLRHTQEALDDIRHLHLI